jgi:hypothetical protein
VQQEHPDSIDDVQRFHLVLQPTATTPTPPEAVEQAAEKAEKEEGGGSKAEQDAGAGLSEGPVVRLITVSRAQQQRSIGACVGWLNKWKPLQLWATVKCFAATTSHQQFSAQPEPHEAHTTTEGPNATMKQQTDVDLVSDRDCLL